MFITLEQAIEIHAKVLLYRAGLMAERRAQDAAAFCEKKGDTEGFQVWMKVAEKIGDIREIPPGPSALPLL